MKIAAITFRLHAPWAHSLKEKRMVIKSLMDDISAFVEDNTEAEILDEEREIR